MSFEGLILISAMERRSKSRNAITEEFLKFLFIWKCVMNIMIMMS
jgi:hypothetical protein